jgi:hypothetical protein
VDETVNGTDDIWWIDEGQDYPKLWWELPIEYTILVVDGIPSLQDFSRGPNTAAPDL